VITLNWNGLEVLPAMVESVADSVEKLHGRLIVFDNGSTDGSERVVAGRWGSSSWFSLIKSPDNLGFAAGANKAIQSVDAEVIVLANSDTVFLPGSLQILLAALEHHSAAGIIGPKLLWPDGTLQPSLRDFPFPGNLFAEHFPLPGRKPAMKKPHMEEQEVDWVVGAVMVFRRDVFTAAGGFDEEFFFYHEETELQYRLFLQGRRSVFVPSAEVIHVEGASARKKFGRETYLKYIQAKLKFLRKHGYTGSSALFRLFMGLLQVCRIAAGIVRPALSRDDIRYTASYCRKAFRELFRRNRRDN